MLLSTTARFSEERDMRILTRFLGRLTCYQCRRVFYPTNLTCPNCGAARRESIGQIALRRVRRAAFGAVFGGVVGGICMGILGALWPELSSNTLTDYPFLQGTFGMILIGLVLGGIFGAVFYSLIELGRDQ
jgi:hypothetical protein